MVQMLCKIWGLGMFSILALAASNIFLTLRLLHSSTDTFFRRCDSSDMSTRSRYFGSSLRNGNHTEYLRFLKSISLVVDTSEKKDMLHLPNEGDAGPSSEYGLDSQIQNKDPLSIDPRLGRFDDRKLFRIFDKVFTGPSYTSYIDTSPVCLATQSSVDRLYWIIQVSRYWDASAISLAIFTPDVEYAIAKIYLKYLLTCFPYLGKGITVHFVYPRQYPPKDVDIILDKLDELCDRPVDVLRRLLKQRPKAMMKWRETMQYPQNLLRNVARKNCGSEWVFLTDVDIIPIPGLSQDVSHFLSTPEASKCQKCAYVVPTYEIDEKSSMPWNRSSLLGLVAAGKARPFHQKVFVYNQHATNFSKWESREREFSGEHGVSVSHNVTHFEFFYEPFYIARDFIPAHDERFLGYGFTRNSQVFEAYLAGFNFRVLSPIFTLHWGMQVKKDRPAWRERQNSENRKLFEGFKREAFAKYQKDPLGMMKPDKSKNRRKNT